MKIFAFILFVLMYILMIAKPAYRPFYALSVAFRHIAPGLSDVNDKLECTADDVGNNDHRLLFH